MFHHAGIIPALSVLNTVVTKRHHLMRHWLACLLCAGVLGGTIAARHTPGHTPVDLLRLQNHVGRQPHGTDALQQRAGGRVFKILRLDLDLHVA